MEHWQIIGYRAITRVAPMPNYQLKLTFETNEVRIFDMNPYLHQPIFMPLKDIAIFQTVRVYFDTVAWSNGADFAPETLYQESIPIEQKN